MILSECTNPDGTVKAHTSRQFRFAGAAPSDTTTTLLLNDIVLLPPQPLTLRVGVASRLLERAGTVQLHLEVPDPTDARLQLSGIAVGIVGFSPPAMNGDDISSLLPFQPTATRTFTPQDSLRVFGMAFWRSSATATVTVAIKAVSSSVSQPVLQISPGLRSGRQATFDATLILAGLQSGPYVIEILASLGGGKSVKREIPILVR